MTSPQDAPILLALDAGVRESGWAIFGPGGVITTGVVGTRTRRRIAAEVRVSRLMRCLDRLVEQWRPAVVVHSLPSGINWPVPALDMLNAALVHWSHGHGLQLYPYTAQEVRAAIAGHPNATRDQLAYAIMLRLGLIGQGKTTHEWEALAVGHYHLASQPAGADRPTGDCAQD